MKQTALELALLAQLIGLVWIFAASFWIRREGGSRSLCVTVSWLLAIAWGFVFCLAGQAWVQEIAPYGWELFPEGPGAMVMFMFGGLIGYGACAAAKPAPKNIAAKQRRLWVIAFSSSVLFVALCFVGIARIAADAKLRGARPTYIDLGEAGLLTKQVQEVKESLQRELITISYAPDTNSPPVEVIRFQVRSWDVEKWPEVYHVGKSAILHYRNDIYPTFLVPGDGIAVLNSAGQWVTHTLGEKYFDRWPEWTTEMERRFGKERRHAEVQSVDLGTEVIEADYQYYGGFKMTLKIHPETGDLSIAHVDWPEVEPKEQ